jgi:hypothetical protein
VPATGHLEPPARPVFAAILPLGYERSDPPALSHRSRRRLERGGNLRVESIEQALAGWQSFYAYLGVVAATLLGLLFVSISLRLNIFRQQEIRDVRDFAFLTFGSFFCLILVSGLFLIPHQTRVGLGLPLAILGLLGSAGAAYIALESHLLNTGAHALSWWSWAAWAPVEFTYLGLLTIGLMFLEGRTDVFGWLVLVDAGLLTVATASAWVLLSHAGSS